VRLSSWAAKINLSETLAITDKASVTSVSGAAFGSDSQIRLSYATSMKNIEEGIKRIKDDISQLE
jgi:aspartate aminotransferase